MKLMALIIFYAHAAIADTTYNPKYFANDSVQRLAPEAFALQPEAALFHQEIQAKAKKERDAFLTLIQEEAGLSEQILKYPHLNWEEKEKVLRLVFSLEIKSLGVTAPELVIDSQATKNQAYFDFDINHPGSGRVLLNPIEIEKDSNPYAGLLLLIHETRHSAQFQEAFKLKTNVALSYKAAFTAQKNLATKIVSFSDFLTLINEYEAFQFGNYVMSVLTRGSVDTLGMGTYASQYNPDLTLKTDLPVLFERLKEGQLKDSVLNTFNELEMAQYEILTK